MTNKGQGIKASLGLEDEKVEELKIFSLILYVFGQKQKWIEKKNEIMENVVRINVPSCLY